MPEPSPAAWHPDPFGRHELRYWDGAVWTSHVSSGGQRAVDEPVASPAAAPVQAPAGWFPDPYGRHERRYWDGARWTEHVTSRDQQTVETPVPVAPAPPAGMPSEKVARQARSAGVDVGGRAGGGTVFTEQVLVINQKAKPTGTTLEYVVHDQHGHRLGAFQEVRRDVATVVTDSLKPFSLGRDHHYRLVDMNHQVLLSLTRPGRGWRSVMIVEGRDGSALGQITRGNRGARAATDATPSTVPAERDVPAALAGVSRRVSSAWEGLVNLSHLWFSLEVGGERIGSIYAEDLRSWDYGILGADGAEIARVTKTWAGWAKERFTRADHYVLQMHRQLEDPLLSLVIATALVIDVELKQGEQVRGSRHSLRPRYYQ